jgi:hypothetical protein
MHLNNGFQADAIAEAFEAAFGVCDGSGLPDLVEIGFAEVAIAQVLSEHVIGGDEDLVGDGERGAESAAASLEAVVLVLGATALVFRRGDRGAAQDGAQVNVALARLAGNAQIERVDVPPNDRRSQTRSRRGRSRRLLVQLRRFPAVKNVQKHRHAHILKSFRPAHPIP